MVECDTGPTKLGADRESLGKCFIYCLPLDKVVNLLTGPLRLITVGASLSQERHGLVKDGCSCYDKEGSDRQMATSISLSLL